MSHLVHSPGSVVEEVRRHRLVRVPSPSGDLVVATPRAITRTGARAAAAGAAVSYVTVALVLHAVGLVLVGQVMLEVLSVVAAVGVAGLLWRDHRSPEGRAARAQAEACRRAAAVEPGDGGGEVPPPVDPGDGDGGGGSHFGAAWRDRKAVTGQRLPVLPDRLPVRSVRDWRPIHKPRPVDR